MSKELINPNLHAVMIHAPLGLLVVGTAIELFAFLWPRSSFRAAARWMMLIGALSLVPVALAGLYAMNDLNRTEATSESTWAEVRAASPIQGHAWEMMRQHALLTAYGSGVLLLLAVLWLASSDIWRGRLHFIFLFLWLAGVGIITFGAWHGGELVYTDAVAVAQHAGSSADSSVDSSAHSSTAPTTQLSKLPRDPAFYLPPMEGHVIFAGLTVAVALAAIGVSLRRNVVRRPEGLPDPHDIGAALNPNLRSVGYGQAPNPYERASTPVYAIERQPVARFFVIALLLAVVTGAAGWWTLAKNSDVWDPNQLVHMVIDREGNEIPRRLAHGALTGGLVVLLALAALISRVAAGRKIVMGIFALILVAAVAAQLWLGALLMLDGSTGSLKEYNGGATSGATASETSPSAPTPKKMPKAVKPLTTTTTTTTPATTESVLP